MPLSFALSGPVIKPEAPSEITSACSDPPSPTWVIGAYLKSLNALSPTWPSRVGSSTLPIHWASASHKSVVSFQSQ